MRALTTVVESAIFGSAALLLVWYAATLPPVYSFYQFSREEGISIPTFTFLSLFVLVPVVVILFLGSAVVLYRNLRGRTAAGFFFCIFTPLVAIAVIAEYGICHPIRLMGEVVPLSPDPRGPFVGEIVARDGLACTWPSEGLLGMAPNKALQLTFDPASRLAAAKQLPASNAAELWR